MIQWPTDLAFITLLFSFNSLQSFSWRAVNARTYRSKLRAPNSDTTHMERIFVNKKKKKERTSSNDNDDKILFILRHTAPLLLPQWRMQKFKFKYQRIHIYYVEYVRIRVLSRHRWLSIQSLARSINLKSYSRFNRSFRMSRVRTYCTQPLTESCQKKELSILNLHMDTIICLQIYIRDNTITLNFHEIYV